MDRLNHLDEPYKESSKRYLTYFKDKFNDNGQFLLRSIQQLPLAICVTDQEGILERVNDAYCNLYQYSKAELVGSHFTKVVPESEKIKLVQDYEKFMENHNELTYEWEVQRKNGETIPVYASAAYVVEGDQPKMVTFVIDITNTKKTENDLKETISKLNTLVSSQEHAMELLLHDLRGPISNVLSLSNFIADDTFFKPDQKVEINKRLRESAQRAFDLTNRLYGIIQIENDKYVPSPSVFNLCGLIDEVWGSLTTLVEAKNLRLEKEPGLEESSLLMIESDAFLFNIIFYNLLKNAVEASPKQEAILVKVERREGKLIVQIHNQGEIPPIIQSSFFQKYITSGKAKGTGLGAYMVKKTMALLQSDISFISNAEAGTSFYLEFPDNMLHQQD